MSKYKKRKMNEMDLINDFSKSQLEELLKIQIENENYEGAQVIKNAINQYDNCIDIELVFGRDEDELRDDDLYIDEDEE